MAFSVHADLAAAVVVAVRGSRPNTCSAAMVPGMTMSPFQPRITGFLRSRSRSRDHVSIDRHEWVRAQAALKAAEARREAARLMEEAETLTTDATGVSPFGQRIA